MSFLCISGSFQSVLMLLFFIVDLMCLRVSHKFCVSYKKVSYKVCVFRNCFWSTFFSQSVFFFGQPLSIRFSFSFRILIKLGIKLYQNMLLIEESRRKLIQSVTDNVTHYCSMCTAYNYFNAYVLIAEFVIVLII